jgi:hypothetical protein
MGWLTMRDTGRFANGRAYLDDQFTYTRDDHRLTVLKSSMVGDTYYAAAERLEAAGEARSVFAIICLTFSRPNARDGQTFGYKDMTEHMGPHESECPASILDLLTPIEGDWPNNWRARCRANLAKRRLLDAKPTPRPGQTIVFDDPLRFNDGIERTRFEVIAGPKGKGLRYRDPSSRQVCQIPSVKKRAYRLINSAVTVPQVAS